MAMPAGGRGSKRQAALNSGLAVVGLAVGGGSSSAAPKAGKASEDSDEAEFEF
jgi:hypothetical protein